MWFGVYSYGKEWRKEVGRFGILVNRKGVKVNEGVVFFLVFFVCWVVF